MTNDNEVSFIYDFFPSMHKPKFKIQVYVLCTIFVTFPCKLIVTSYPIPNHPEFSSNQQIFQRKCSIFINLHER
jgi:hypothetical protein